jgi:hypothetical protein
MVMTANIKTKDDRAGNVGNVSQKDHYSTTFTERKTAMFGTHGMYRDFKKARNAIRVMVQTPRDPTVVVPIANAESTK